MAQNQEMLINSETLTNIADTIREHQSSQELFYPEAFSRGIDRAVWLKQPGIVFVTEKPQIRIGLSGQGKVNIFVNGAPPVEKQLEEEIQTFPIDTWTPSSVVRIQEIGKLVELNLSGNQLSSFSVNSQTALNKLVIYDNDIKKLDCSLCPDLQYLHMHDNPICDEDKYLAELESCIESLPNRKDRALGSIILYPWYGLETLICEVDGQYKKYPIDTWTHFDGNQRPSYWADKQLNLVENKLYGVVSSKGQITYYIYKQGDLAIHKDMNRHHNLRKNLELEQTLKKNWMFGSAIQYHNDYNRCYHYFRDIGVQDVWETAEKGFGLCIGSIDNFSGNVSDWEDFNIKAYLKTSGEPQTPYGKKATHGDKILSHIAGRGGLSPFGICPNASFLIIDPLTVNVNGIKILTQPENCDSITFSFAYNEKSSGNKYQRRFLLGEFGKKGIITESAGNSGDGVQWTMEESGYKMSGFGNFGDSINDTSIKYHTNVFLVSSLNPMRHPSMFSCTSNEANNFVYTDGLTTEDFISHYGEQIASYKEGSQGPYFIQGTSMASPNCNATLLLMRKIYAKINPQCDSFGKYSEFMEYVKENWIDPIDDAMSFAVGIGIPCFNHAPRQKVWGTIPPKQATYPSKIQLGQPFKIQSVVSDNCKNKITYGHNFRDFAKINDSLIPIRLNAQGFNIYTNSAIDSRELSKEETGTFRYNSNYKTELIEGIEILDNSTLQLQAKNNIHIGVEKTMSTGDSFEQYITLDKEFTDFTLQIPILFSYEHFTDNVEIQGLQTLYFIDIARYYIDNNYAGPLTTAYIEIKDGGDQGVILSVPAIFEYEGETYKNALKCCRPLSYAIGAATIASSFGTKRINLQQNDLFILTVVFSKEDGTTMYYNGNLINKVISEPNFDLTASTLFVTKKILINNSAEDVIWYDKALSQEEVINNTIVLLRDLEEAQ